MATDEVPERTEGQLETQAEEGSPASRALLPVERYLRHVYVSAIGLIGGALLALVAVNSPLAPLYRQLWSTPVVLLAGDLGVRIDLRTAVIEGLMALFFLVVTVEVKRELTHGSLARPQSAIFALAAALGGMAVPALIYVAVNLALDGAPGGWGVPVATDVAFTLGLLALVTGASASPMRSFLLSTTIVDDVAGIVLIAIVYVSAIHLGALAVAAALAASVFVLARFRVYNPVPYAALGLALWIALEHSGVHPTLAGVLIGATVPAEAAEGPVRALRRIREAAGSVRDEARSTAARRQRTRLTGRIEELAVESEPPLERVSRILQPWTRYLILPLFAFAATDVRLDLGRLPDLLTSPVALGVLLGLVVGKPAGMLSAMWLSERLGIGRRPEGLSWRQAVGIALLAGIGFTVALFIADLAFTQERLAEAAKVGILVASPLAALVAALWLRLVVLTRR